MNDFETALDNLMRAALMLIVEHVQSTLGDEPDHDTNAELMMRAVHDVHETANRVVELESKA